MFKILALPFDPYADLPTPTHRWLMTCLARYADRDGRAFPTERQLAADARLSPATVCRYLRDLAALGAFERVRQGVGRYVYRLAEAYRLRWKPKQDQRVSRQKHRVSQAETPNKVEPFKNEEDAREDLKWRARLRQLREYGRWAVIFGPLPGQPGCKVPPHLLAIGQRSHAATAG